MSRASASLFGPGELAPVATILTPEDHSDPGLARSAGRAAAHVEVGEIAVRGEAVMLGYWNQPEITSAAVVDGWMHTGDGGYVFQPGSSATESELSDFCRQHIAN